MKTIPDLVKDLRAITADSPKLPNMEIIRLFHLCADTIEYLHEAVLEEQETLAVVHLGDPKDIAEIARLKGELNGSN